MTVKTRDITVKTRNIPHNNVRVPSDILESFTLKVTDDHLGSGVADAFTRKRDDRFESVVSHAAAHQRYRDETTVHATDDELFRRLKAGGFFGLKKPRMEPEVQTFNLLRGIQNALPGKERESFFTKDGLGGRLLAEVVENHKQGPPVGEHRGGGQISDYLRRVGSLLPFIPPQDRNRFLADDVPRLLEESKSYLEFLEKTSSYLPKPI